MANATKATVKPNRRLRAWREEQGLSYAELSELVGLSPSMLYRLEVGERDLAALKKVAMARRLGVPIGVLFEVEPLRADEADQAVDA